MKIAVALSGGVDSAVAAKILKAEGHDLVGLFLKLWTDPTSPSGLRGAGPSISSTIRGAGPTCAVKSENRCCDYQALEDARAVANQLEIPFYVINAKAEFKKAVVDDFIAQYQKLRTPNPCVICNEKIKFDLLLKKALAIGCEKMATGHYARIVEDNSGNSKFEIRNSKQTLHSKLRNKDRQNYCHSGLDPESRVMDPRVKPEDDKLYHLKSGIDKTKDQSYMLYRLNQHQLSKVVFPLGDMTKKEVRALAVKWNLPVKEKAESQEICFFGDRDYRDFLRRYLPSNYFKPGEIRDIKGRLIGKHQGLVNYTIGQRKGVAQDFSPPTKLQIKRNYEITNHTNCHSELAEESSDRKPLYVVGYEAKKNQLIVGEDREIYQKEMVVGDLNWINGQRNLETQQLKNIKVKIRYRHEAVPCKITLAPTKLQIKRNYKITDRCNYRQVEEPQGSKVIFDTSQRAVTPGQSAVFYCWNEVLGGGVIK